VKDREEGVRAISQVCQAVGIEFDESLVTTTTVNRRPPVERRTTDLPGWKHKPTKNVHGPYEFTCVRFLLNGMDKPLTLLDPPDPDQPEPNLLS